MRIIGLLDVYACVPRGVPGARAISTAELRGVQESIFKPMDPCKGKPWQDYIIVHCNIYNIWIFVISGPSMSIL